MALLWHQSKYLMQELPFDAKVLLTHHLLLKIALFYLYHPFILNHIKHLQ
jgi:hypothetical protein